MLLCPYQIFIEPVSNSNASATKERKAPGRREISAICARLTPRFANALLALRREASWQHLQ
jgi:hypothetical protein